MWIFSFKGNKTALHYLAISTIFLLVLFAGPASSFAQDTDSIKALRQMGKAFAEISEKASPAVVGITAKQVVTQEDPTLHEWPFGDPFDDDFFEHFFGRPAPRRRSSEPRYYKETRPVQGSGFIVSSAGYILTANHLVGEAEKVMVKQGNNQEVEAKVIGTDPASDVAVIKIDGNKLPFLELADSDKLEVGEWVLAIGNPFGLSHTVTAGIVSAKGRSGFQLAEYEDYIQTDAAINPGNSGGPLLNLDGKVVGINTAIVTGHLAYRGNIGIGFAIPINMAKSIYNQLMETGKVVRGFLGVGIQDLTAENAPFFGLKQDTKGVLVPEVTKGSAAEKAGLKPGDVIIELNGKPVETAKELQGRVAALKPDTDVELVVLRDGKRETVSAKLSERPPKEQVAKGGPETLEKLGLVVQNLTDDLAKQYGYEGLAGVIVTQVEPGSIAEIAGITPGALIMEVNRKPVENTKSFKQAIEDAAKEDAVLLRIKQGQAVVFLVMKLPKEKG
jgi:serine protease Do